MTLSRMIAPGPSIIPNFSTLLLHVAWFRHAAAAAAGILLVMLPHTRYMQAPSTGCFRSMKKSSYEDIGKEKDKDKDKEKEKSADSWRGFNQRTTSKIHRTHTYVDCTSTRSSDQDALRLSKGVGAVPDKEEEPQKLFPFYAKIIVDT